MTEDLPVQDWGQMKLANVRTNRYLHYERRSKMPAKSVCAKSSIERTSQYQHNSNNFLELILERSSGDNGQSPPSLFEVTFQPRL